MLICSLPKFHPPVIIYSNSFVCSIKRAAFYLQWGMCFYETLKPRRSLKHSEDKECGLTDLLINQQNEATNLFLSYYKI